MSIFAIAAGLPPLTARRLFYARMEPSAAAHMRDRHPITLWLVITHAARDSLEP